jgi:hypothetical protein
MSDHEKVELLLWDFSLRAQEDEDRAYRKYKRFSDASERVELAREEHRIAEDRRVMRYFDQREARGYQP